MNYAGYFDSFVNRAGTCSVKWDETDKSKEVPVIPLWVADMDFCSPPEVVDALRERAAHAIYGYTGIPVSYYKTLSAWYATRYGTKLESDNFVSGRGTVPSLAVTVRTWSKPGDGVMVFSPVYFPFYEVIRRNGRRRVEVPLSLNEEGRYKFEINRAEAALREAGERGIAVPMMIFCSPHNPSGTVWSRKELAELLLFAKQNNIIVIADEIHGDFVYDPLVFTSLASFPEYSSQAVIVSGANKTFNLGGLHVSHFVLRDPALKNVLKRTLTAEYSEYPDLFSLLAAETAYRRGSPWLDELKAYVKANIDEAVNRLNVEARGFRAYTPQGTYLIWADVSELMKRKNCPNTKELAGALEAEGRVKLTPGSSFGPGGEGFVRINAACPHALLEEALNRMSAWTNS
jgi:cystathionine beta-lyase